MKKIIYILILTIGIIEIASGQEISLPKTISISDRYSSPWGRNLFYEYQLKLNGENYIVNRATCIENGKNKRKKKEIGTVPKKLIEQVLIEIDKPIQNEIDVSEFSHRFPIDSINNFLEREADNYWITNDYQKQFIIEQLTDSKKLENSLRKYFKDYDHSKWIDGTSTEVKINFHFDDSTKTISSKSILKCGLPIEIDNEKTFSLKLAKYIGEIIPKSKSKRNEQFSDENLFSSLSRGAITDNRNTLDRLESKSYQMVFDSLEKEFIVSNKRVVNAVYSTNWNGEKRLNCVLRNGKMGNNISISYSTQIENGKIKFPESLIISEYQKIYKQVINSSFFSDFLNENNERELSIIYDDRNCFTDKSRKFASKDCNLENKEIDFDNSIFISLKNEFGNSSRWGLLPNGQFFMWWNSGTPPTPKNDDNYLNCE